MITTATAYSGCYRDGSGSREKLNLYLRPPSTVAGAVLALECQIKTFVEVLLYQQKFHVNFEAAENVVGCICTSAHQIPAGLR